MTNVDLHNILLVEDTLTQALMLKHLLEARQYKVQVAKSGQAAIEHLQSNRPAAILSDVNMPEMDGYELCKALKSDENTRGIPFILLASFLNATDILEILKCGADGFVFKCYDESYFVQALRDVLESIDRASTLNDIKHKTTTRSLDGMQREIYYQEEKLLGMLLSTFTAAVHQNVVKVKQET